jgi:hypothetical protein
MTQMAADENSDRFQFLSIGGHLRHLRLISLGFIPVPRRRR